MPSITAQSKLTPRQLETARLVVYGLSRDEIATKLGLATNTVKVHLHQAYSRLGVHKRDELAKALEPYR